jgi:radical SAM protein with 4Fe4S-binding SPASM domain
MYQGILEKVGGAAASGLGVSLYDLHLLVRKWARAVRFFAAGRSLPVFSELALETTAFCNRHCVACPVSFAPRPKDGAMDDAVFSKVVEELGRMKFSGRIALHFFNEPLADKDIVTKVRRIAGAVPRATIEMNSNGDYLTRELLESLVEAGLSFMLVTAYTDAALAKLQRLHRNLGRREHRRTVIHRAPEYVGNRAGTLEHLAVPEALDADCFQPSYKLVVNYRGDAVICTNDYFAKSVMGNVAEQSLLEIWQGPAFQEARRTLRQRERGKLPACKGCNLISTPLGMHYLTAAQTVAYNDARRPR